MPDDLNTDLLAGQNVSHYRVIQRIGAGAMGSFIAHATSHSIVMLH